MTKNRTKWHEDIFIGITFLAYSLFITFNGFTFLTSLFIIDGEVVGGSTKQKGIVAFASLVEQSYWKYPLLLIFFIIAVFEINKGVSKFKVNKKASTDENVNLYEIAVVNGIKNLVKYGFRVIETKDTGMHKYVSISNESITFIFTYDRGYINCNAKLKNGKLAGIVALANFKYYTNEVSKPFSNPKSIQEGAVIEYYSRIIEQELRFFTDFIGNNSQEKLRAFEDWDSVNGTEYWVNRFKENDKPIPESLKIKINK